jgi:hypothetical protein
MAWARGSTLNFLLCRREPSTGTFGASTPAIGAGGGDGQADGGAGDGALDDEPIRAHGVTLCDVRTRRRTEGVSLDLGVDQLRLTSSDSEEGKGLQLQIGLTTSHHLSATSERKGLFKKDIEGLQLHHRIVDDPHAPLARSLLEFGSDQLAKSGRDRFLGYLRRRTSAAVARAGATFTEPPAPADNGGVVVSEVAPSRMRITAVTTPQSYTIYVIECTSAETGCPTQPPPRPPAHASSRACPDG